MQMFFLTWLWFIIKVFTFLLHFDWIIAVCRNRNSGFGILFQILFLNLPICLHVMKFFNLCIMMLQPFTFYHHIQLQFLPFHWKWAFGEHPLLLAIFLFIFKKRDKKCKRKCSFSENHEIFMLTNKNDFTTMRKFWNRVRIRLNVYNSKS